MKLKTICQTRIHCVTCRDRVGGREWRESLGKVITLPNNLVDFECPHGVEWSVEKKEFEFITKRRKICKECSNKMCLVKHSSGCETDRILGNLNSSCVLDKWPLIERLEQNETD